MSGHCNFCGIWHSGSCCHPGRTLGNTSAYPLPAPTTPSGAEPRSGETPPGAGAVPRRDYACGAILLGGACKMWPESDGCPTHGVSCPVVPSPTPPGAGAVRHASRMADDYDIALCGATNGFLTDPKEVVNCPTCRVILNHVRDRYPEHARHTDWRLTAKQEERAARDFVADMYGGADD